MPVEDRAADAWEPLVAVADAVGGHWPTMARETCRALVAAADSADEDKALGVKLLVDIRQVLAEKNVPFLPSTELVTELRRIEGVAVGRVRAESQQTGVSAAGVRPQAAAQPGRERPRICAGSILGRFCAVHPSEPVRDVRTPGQAPRFI
jgi:hypothetical protein